MSDVPVCPKCQSSYAYEDRSLFVCPECGYEWSASVTPPDSTNAEKVIYDAHGNILKEGDTVTLIKDLKVKGSSTVLKVGLKAKITQLLDGDHNINCRLQGMGSMELKSEFVKKYRFHNSHKTSTEWNAVPLR